jgi:hypothetical protein
MDTRLLTTPLASASFIVLLSAAPIHAEAAQVGCQIPFSFIVHGTTLPAGTYQASVDAAQGLIAIRGYHTAVFTIVNYVESRDEKNPMLVFHRYGDQYYLREIWLGGRSGRELLRNGPKGEPARTAKDGAPGVAFERVVIAAQ